MIRSLLLRILKEMTEPICIKPKLTMGIIILVFLTAIYAEVQITDLVQQNANNYLLLACEAITESGGESGFASARTDHARMLEYYLGREEDKRVICWLLGVLYPKLSPAIQLGPALEALKNQQAEESGKVIQDTADVLNQFVKNSEEISYIRSATAYYEISFKKSILEDVNDALTEAQKAVTKYEKDRNLANAELTCRANRRAITLVYPIRYSYENFITRDRLKQFRHDIDRTIYYNNMLSKTASTEDNKLLTHYSTSELRRLKIIQAILDEDMETARTLLKTAIEEAYKTERIVRK